MATASTLRLKTNKPDGKGSFLGLGQEWMRLEWMPILTRPPTPREDVHLLFLCIPEAHGLRSTRLLDSGTLHRG